MKKIISTLLMCAVAAGMVTAEVTVSGALYTGVEANIKDGNVQSRIYNSDKEKPSRLDLDFAYKGVNTGFKSRLRTNDLAAPEVNYAFVYMNCFENLLTLKAGKSDKGSWKTKGEEEYNFTEKAAAVLEISPVTGLNFGASVAADKDFAAVTKDNFAIGAAYNADIFSVQGGFSFAGAAYAGFSLDPVAALSIIAEASVEDLYGEPSAVISEELEYTIFENFAAGLVMYQKIVKEAYSFKPYIVFTAVPGVDISLAGFYEIKDEDEWYIRPGVSVQTGEKTKFGLFYQYDNLTESTVQLDAVIKF